MDFDHVIGVGFVWELGHNGPKNIENFEAL
jgi:hypothetical protein